jgi:hypothetical protein
MENQIEIINENQRDVELLEKNRKINLQKLFTPEGMDLIISEIQKEVADFTADIATKEGRAKIISMAHKVAKCKSPIKNLASELKEESKKLIDGVNSQLNRYEKAMDDLRDAVRKPVDEIEEKEAKILKEKQDRLSEIERLSTTRSFNSVQDLKGLLQDLEQAFNYDWNDFQFKAKSLHDIAKNYLELEIEKFIKYEAEQAELAQLKKEKAERDKKDAEERIAKEAEERAKKEAEESIKSAEQAKIDAESRARESERLAKDQAERAELARIQAEKKAKEEAERLAIEAVEKERQRVAEIARKEAEAIEKREANKRHRNKIEKEAILGLVNCFKNTGLDISEFQAKEIIDAISKNQIPNLTINY